MFSASLAQCWKVASSLSLTALSHTPPLGGTGVGNRGSRTLRQLLSGEEREATTSRENAATLALNFKFQKNVAKLLTAEKPQQQTD